MLKPGEILNRRYQITQKIGDGASAQVFTAQDISLNRVVAVKVLDTDFSDAPNAFKRFQIEARAIAALDHPNIIAIYDFGLLEEDQSAFLVIPYVQNGPLSKFLAHNKVSLEMAANYVEQIAAALDYAHSQGIVHRDVKPSNILLRSDNRVILSDFGFAKITDDAGRLTQTQALGTIEYSAPEQIYGMVNATSDQYALGVVLYQMLAGELPFTGSKQNILTGHAEQPPPPLKSKAQFAERELPSDVVVRLDRIIARVMAKNSSERYPNCAELTRAFRQAIQTTPRTGYNLGVGAGTDGLNNVAAAFQAPPMPVNAKPKLHLRQPARLTVVTQPDQGIQKSFDLNLPQLKLGRNPENELYLPLAIISRYHATLLCLETTGGYRIVDNKSLNGLIYRGQFIREKTLEDGDVIEIGRLGVSEYIVKLTYNAPILG
jgi:serine/threonine protein kinase